MVAVLFVLFVSSPALQLFYSPRHLVDFLLQANDDVALLFRAGVGALRRTRHVTHLLYRGFIVFTGERIKQELTL